MCASKGSDGLRRVDRSREETEGVNTSVGPQGESRRHRDHTTNNVPVVDTVDTQDQYGMSTKPDKHLELID